MGLCGRSDYVSLPFLGKQPCMRYRFGPQSRSCVIDYESGVLRVGDRVVRIEPLQWKLLEYLIEKRGALVTRDALLRDVWGGRAVEDRRISKTLSSLRKALGDNATRPHFIQTVHRRGVRLIAPVEACDPEHSRETLALHDPNHHVAGRCPQCPGSGPFVGRESELRQLMDALAEAVSGRGRICLLSGEAGIGKTRTAEEFMGRAASCDARLAIGRCSEATGAPPFWMWRAALRDWLPSLSPPLQSVLGANVAAAAEVVPEIREALQDAAGKRGVRGGLTEADEATRRFDLFDRFGGVLKNLAGERPLVFLFDDLQLADTASLLLLQFVAPQIETSRILITGTYRDTDLRHSVGLERVVSGLIRSPVCRQLKLSGLNQEEAKNLLDATLRMSIAPETRTKVFEWAGGNPLLLCAAAASLEAGHDLRHIPPEVIPVLRQMLDLLSPKARRVLSVAAVLGGDLDLDLLARVCRLRRQAVVEALDCAAGVGILTPPSGSNGYRFAHEMKRETAYRDVPTFERGQLHARVARALGSESAQPRQPSQIAHHLVQAWRNGHRSGRKAVQLSIRAGQLAADLCAYEDALRHFETAEELLATHCPENRSRRCDLLIRRSAAELAAGHGDAGRQHGREAVALAQQAKDVLLFARAVEVFGQACRQLGMPSQESCGLYEAALEMVADKASVERVRLLIGLARELALGSDHTRAARLSQEAFELARRLGDRRTMVAALSVAVNVCGTANDLQRQLHRTDELIGAPAGSDPEFETEIRSLRFHLLTALGDAAAARCEYAARATSLPAIQAIRPAYIHRLQAAFLMFLDGDIKTASVLAFEAERFGAPGLGDYALQMLGIQLTYAHWLQGHLDEAVSLLEAAIGRHAQPAWRCGLAFMHSYRGSTKEAENLVAAFATTGFAQLPRDANWLVGMALLAEACGRLGDTAHTAMVYEALRPYADTCVIIGPVAVSYGSVFRHLGLLAARLGRWQEAGRHFQSAITANMQQGNRPMLALTHLQYAQAVRTADPATARQEAEEVRRLVGSFALPLLEKEVLALKSTL